MDLINLQFVKLSSSIKTPSKSTKFAVGLDIHSPTDYLISAKDQTIIPTGLRIQVPSGHYGHLCSKSGDAIAQLILEKVSTPILHRVDTLPSTNRGDRGCGLPKSNTL